MKKVYTVLSLIALNGCVQAFTLPQACIIRTELIIPYIINNDFHSALTSTDSIIDIDPNDPFPYILKLTALGMRDLDFDRTLDSVTFLSTYQHAIESVNALELKSGKSSYSRMMAGFCMAMYSAYYLRNKSYIAALQNGFDALDILEEARVIDSTNTEVLMFLGLYDFARAELKSRLWWILFWYPGNRSTGIAKLKQCSIKSTLTKTASKLSLSEIYIKENKMFSADSLLAELEQQYPQSRFVFWSKVKYFEAQKDYAKAAKIYEKLAQSYLKTQEGRYNYFVTTNLAAHMLKNSGQLNDALALCQSLLREPDLNQYKDIRKDTQRLMERVEHAESKS